MLCYRDRCYCSRLDCTRNGCTRRVTEDVKHGAARTGLPIDMADFNNGKCYTNSNKSEMRNEK